MEIEYYNKSLLSGRSTRFSLGDKYLHIFGGVPPRFNGEPTEKLIERMKCGHGRSEPNQNPCLPPPTGRFKFTLNPFSLLYQMVGPKAYAKVRNFLLQVVCCLICILIVYYAVPVVFGNIATRIVLLDFR